ncbi:hypothetical protein J5U21_02263 [Saccharolobus shibatae]|uniref:Tetratricopeptide repeat protein n=2 Tax=Saccharolobus shibatae TaxID=2286 RepID=A0A8F5GXM1_9CREN|nr:hypothetical protein J5U21_02263 [Saccharolobus shibatae]
MITIIDKRTGRGRRVFLRSDMGPEEVANQVRKVLGINRPLIFLAKKFDGREVQIANPDARTLWEIIQAGSQILVEPVEPLTPLEVTYDKAASEDNVYCGNAQTRSIRKVTTGDLWLDFDKDEEAKELMGLAAEPFTRNYVKEMFKIGVYWISNGYYDKAVETFKEVAQAVDWLTPMLAYIHSLSRYYYSYFVDAERPKLLSEAAKELDATYPCSGVAKSKFTALRALIYAELGDLYRTERLLKEGGNSSLVLRLAMAHVYRLRGLLGLAEQEVSYVLSQDKKNRDAVIEKALILREEGRYEEALSLLDKLLYGSPLFNPLNLISYFPQNTLAMLFRAETLELMGRNDEALSAYRQIDSTLYSPIVKSRVSRLSGSSRRTSV